MLAPKWIFPIALVAAAGCGWINDLKPKVSPENAVIAGNVGAQSAETSAARYDPPAASAFAFAFAPGDCGVGTYTDADLDHWPDTSAVFTWSDCVKSYPIGTATLNGTVTIVDTSVGTRSLDFTADPIQMTIGIVDTANDANVTLTVSGSATGTAPDKVQWNAHQLWNGTLAGTAVDIAETVGWTTIYTSPGWLPGSPMADGTLTISGQWNATVNGDPVNATVSTVDGNGAASTLTVTESCESKITAGTLRFKFDNGPRDGKITVTWTGCGSRSVDVNL